MGPFIIAAIFVFACWGVLILIKLFLRIAERKSPLSFDTDSSKFSVSSGIDSMLKKKDIDETNPTILYEELCIKNPLDHINDPRIPEVISKYRDIIKGLTPDPMGQYAPSEKIEGQTNEDYIVYLKNQKKNLTKQGINVEWMKNELARMKNLDKANQAVSGFFSTLIDMGLPAILFPIVVTEERMETYKPTDWKKLIKAIEEYIANDCALQNIGVFLLHYNDEDIIYSSDKMYQFDMLLKHDVPIPLAKMVVEDKIDIGTMVDVINKVQHAGYTWDEAIQETFILMLEDQERQQLRDEYRKAVKNSKKITLKKENK
jgi:hypothetical protein